MGEINVGLTSTEISNIWSSYLKSSMELRFFQYFYETADDLELKKILEKMVVFSEKSLNDLKNIFLKENLTIPLGFTEKDVRLDVEKVFSDTFILYICHDITMLSLTTYPSAFPDCTRNDTRDYFQGAIEFTIGIQNEITDQMLQKGIFLKSPQVAMDHTIDLADEMKYLNGLFGHSRPLNAPEIANLSRILHRARFSKMVLLSFSKLASHKEIKQHLSKGVGALNKVLDTLEDAFNKENIPYSASGDFNFFEVNHSPFSDKLMLFFVNTCIGMFCFIMINQALTSSLRSDIVTKFTLISAQMKKFYGKGLLLMITEKWLEQPPQVFNRKS